MPDYCPFEVTPLSQSSIIKNEKIINLNYTHQDFWSLKNKLVEFINERFGDNGSILPNTFNDLVEGSIAIMLIENWAFMADTLSFKMDQMVNELFIDTVTETDNAFRLCRLVGFKPTPPIPSRSMWTATLNAIQPSDIILSTPLEISIAADGLPITIELFAADSENKPDFSKNIIIPAGASINSSIIGLEGRTILDEFTGSGEVLQSYPTRYDSVLYESVVVRIDGKLWDQVEFFTDSQPRKEYRVEFDSDYRAYIMFGNNRAGMSPSMGSRISINYRIGGGVIGNIVTGFADAQKLAEVIDADFNVPVFLRNYTRGEFGYDGDTIEDIRRKLPLYLRTQDRAVTGADYKTITDQFKTAYSGQIGKSIAVLRNHGCAGNLIDIYILAKNENAGLQEATDNLKYELNIMLEDKKMITDHICIKNGQIIETDISIEVTLSRINKKLEQEIRQKIEFEVQDFFNLNDWEFGQNLRQSDLIKKLSSIKETQSFDIIFTTNDDENSGDLVLAKYYEIIRPSETSVSFMYV